MANPTGTMNLENQADDDKAEGGPAAPQAPSANLAPPLPPPAPVSASGTKPILPPAANAPPIPPVAEHSESGEEADASEYEETDGEETSEEETDGDTVARKKLIVARRTRTRRPVATRITQTTTTKGRKGIGQGATIL